VIQSLGRPFVWIFAGNQDTAVVVRRSVHEVGRVAPLLRHQPKRQGRHR
jgi:hypothetical protein